MKLVVKCRCGKVLHVPQKYAGKKGRCPQCARLLVVPEKGSSVAEKLASCPTCGAYLSPGDEECVSCRTNVRTGEWKHLSPRRPARGFPWSKCGLVASHLALFFYIVYLLSQPQDVSSPHQEEGMAQRRQQKISREKTLRAIEKMPETSLAEISDKEKALLALLEQNQAAKAALKMRKRLLQKKSLLSLQHEKKVLQERTRRRDLFRQWRMWKDFITDCSHEQTKKEAQAHLRKLEQRMASFFNSHSSQLYHLLQEQRYYEIVSRIAPRVLSKLAIFLETEKNASSEMAESYAKFLRLCQEARRKSTPKINVISREEQRKIENYQKKYRQYLEKYYTMMYARRYDEVQKQLEKFWQDVNSLESIDHDHELISSIRNKLREVQSIKALFSLANAGAKKSIGLKKTLFPRKGKVAIGHIEKYILGEFHVKDKKGGTHRVMLRQLRAEDVVFFALREQKSKHSYLFSGIFLGYEKAFSQARDCFIRSLTHGSDVGNIQDYLNWCEDLEQRERRALLEQKAMHEKRRREQEREERREMLEENTERVLRIFPQLIEAFKELEHEQVFKHLQRIKELLPYEELVKINRQLIKRHGMSFSEIATSSLTTCKTCDNTGQLPCMVCLKAAISNCRECQGKRYRKCPACSKRRDSREYKLLVKFFTQVR